MSPDPASSEFRFEKRRTEAEISLSSGESMHGCIFTASGVIGHEGPERVGDLLNADPRGFFPFEVHGKGNPHTVLINRAHVVTVAISENEAVQDAGYDVATRRLVSVQLSTAQRVTGTIRVYRPEGRDRLSDWTRQPGIFRYIETGDAILIVNTTHIVAVSEVPAS